MHRRTLGLLLLIVTVACYSDRSVGVAGRRETDAPAPAKPKFPSKIVGQTGESLSLASPLGGDMDGDGLDDFFVYAQRDAETDGTYRRPLLYLFYGKADFPPQLSTADAEAAFEVDSGFNGAVGDLNGDGYTDALFSQFNAANFVFGSKQRLHGLIERSTGGVMWTVGALPPPFSSELLIGWIVSPAGDVNGDGCADLIVSASALLNVEGELVERGWVVPGYRGEWQDTEWDASSAIADIGYGVGYGSLDPEMNVSLLMAEPMGDVDGDRREDLVALSGAGSLMFYGKSEYPNELSSSAADANLLAVPAVPAGSESPFGVPILGVRRLQDLDADGKGDLSLGPGLDGFQIVYGRHWSGKSELEPDLEISIDGPEKHVVDAAAGDIDGDGLPELLLSVIESSNVDVLIPSFAAGVYVLRGTGERLRGKIQLSESDRWNVPVPEGATIQTLVLAGDIDGDGSQEVLTSLPPANLFSASGPVYLVPSTPRAPD